MIRINNKLVTQNKLMPTGLMLTQTSLLGRHTSFMGTQLISLTLVNSKSINSLSVGPRAPSSQGRIDKDRLSTPDLENSTLNQSQIEEAVNMVDNSFNEITLEHRGIKRSQNDPLTPVLSDNDHLNKKVLQEKFQDNEQSINALSEPDTENTANWVNKTFDVAETPEPSQIPGDYLSEWVIPWRGHDAYLLEMKYKLTKAKEQANSSVDEIIGSRELLDMYVSNVKLRVREIIPSKFSKNIDYDNTYLSSLDNGNTIPDNIPMGFYLPTDSSDYTGAFDDDASIFNNNSVAGDSNYAILASGDLNDANLISENLNEVNLEYDNDSVLEASNEDNSEYDNDSVLELSNEDNLELGNLDDANLVPNNHNHIHSPIDLHIIDNSIHSPINPEFADNPELTVLHHSGSDDFILSNNVSSDGPDPYLGTGLDLLDNGLKWNEVTFSEMVRQDTLIHSNYMIQMRGIDDMDYRTSYEYLMDTLKHLDILIAKYWTIYYLEQVLKIWDPNLVIESGKYGNEIYTVLDLISSFN